MTSGRLARRAAPSAATLASIGSVRQRVDLLLSLTASDLRARYGRGRLQFLKWVLDPFAVVGVYLVLVAIFLDRPGDSPGLALTCAVVPFQLVMLSVVNGMTAVQTRRSIILNIRFPRSLIPVSSVLTDAAVFSASLLLLAGMMAVYSVTPTPAVGWLPAVLALNLVFSIACAYPASLIGLWFSDLRPFVVSFVRTAFFLAPGLVVLADITGRANDLVKLNPLTGVFEAYRDVFMYGERPALWELGIPLAWALALFAAFVPLYRREQRQFAKLV